MIDPRTITRCLTAMTLAVVVLVATADDTAPAGDAADAPKTEKGDRENQQIKQMLLDRPQVPITRPVHAAAYVGPKPPKMPADGSYVEDRLVRLRTDPAGGWVLVIFADSNKDSPDIPRWALPCRLLAKLEALAAKHPQAVFRITGENTVYDKRCFILITKATILEKMPEPATAVTDPPAATTQPAEATVPTTQPAVTGAVTTQPAAAAATRPAQSNKDVAGAVPSPLPGVDPDVLIKQMRRDVAGKPVIEEYAPETTRQNQPSIAPGAKVVIEERRGTVVVDRLVTIEPAGAGRWLEVRFAADNNLQEPPLRLLPCRMLRRAELLVASSRPGKTVQLKVSGIMTFYKGQRYLLLRKALIERDLDRF